MFTVILNGLIGACFFAAIVALLSIPWMTGGDPEKH